MSLPGPITISPPASVNTTQELILRPFQRVTAQILSATGNHAVLAIGGYPVVAQLPSAQQAAALLARKTAQFVVAESTPEKIVLKMVGNDQMQAVARPAAFSGPELAARLLEQNNLPVTINNLMMARSVLKRQLPPTPGVLNELLTALDATGAWGQAEADLAASLKAAGLPVSAETIALASRPPGGTADSLARLTSLLNNVNAEGLPPDLVIKLKMQLQKLSQWIVRGDGASSELAEQLKAAVRMLGRSLESLLLEGSQRPGARLPENGLLALLQLEQLIEKVGKKDLAEAVTNFYDDLRLNQLLNSKPDAPGDGRWLEFDFSLQKSNGKLTSARLRIARDEEPDPVKAGASPLHLILQVDLEPGRAVEADLTIADRQIHARLTAADPAWRRQAEEALPSLKEALEAAGFRLNEAEVVPGEPKPFERLGKPASGNPLMAVNIEV